MNRLRERLYRQYDHAFLRANSLDGDAVGPAVAQRYVEEYECEFGTIMQKLPPGAPIVDAGCGMGFLLYWLSLARHGRGALVGVEISEGQLNLARRSLPADVELVQESALEYLKRHDNTFGAIFCTDVLEHLESEEDLLDFLEAARSALTLGGMFVCRVPNMANLAGGHLRYIDMTHSRGFTSGSLLQLLEGVGFARASILPRKAANARQWLRIRIEYAIHWALFRACGVGNEVHFGRTVVGVGER